MAGKLKWLVLIAAVLLMKLTFALTIGSKGHLVGPNVHTTYFITPNNASIKVIAQAYAGNWLNGFCQPGSAQQNLGSEQLRTGDFVDLDAFAIKSLFGSGYSCLLISYYHKQLITEVVQLNWDGFNYNNSVPFVTEIMLI